MGYIEFCSLDCGLSYCALAFVCLMQLLSYMLWMKRMFNDFLIRKRTWIVHVIKDHYSVHDLYFVYVVKAFITLD
jgi:hypothetical protein